MCFLIVDMDYRLSTPAPLIAALSVLLLAIAIGVASYFGEGYTEASNSSGMLFSTSHREAFADDAFGK